MRSSTPQSTSTRLVPRESRGPSDGNGRRVVCLTLAVEVPARRVSFNSELAVEALVMFPCLVRCLSSRVTDI